MPEEKITDPRVAFLAGCDHARWYYGTTADGTTHGAECDKARNPDCRCTCDHDAETRHAVRLADEMVGEDTRQVAALRAEFAAMERRAVAAELDAAHDRVLVEERDCVLGELQGARWEAIQRRFEDSRTLESDVEALADAVRELATAYGRAEQFEEVSYEEQDEDDPPGLRLLDARALIPALAGLLSELAAADHPSIAYPTPGQRTVRVAEAAARGVLGDPAGTITQAVRAALEAAVELHRVRELRGGGEPEPTSSYEIRTDDEVWVRSPLRSDRWVPAIVIEVEPDGGPVTLMSDGADTSDRFSRMTIPQPVTFDQVRPRGVAFDRAVIVPPVEECAGAAPA